MLALVATLLRWEWFKLRRRWMPWILLAFLLAFAQLFLWGNFFSYLIERNKSGSVSIGADASGERSVVVTVICSELLDGAKPELPPGTDPSLIESVLQRCEEIVARERFKEIQDMRANFTLPESLSNTLAAAQGMGLILIAILTASALGTEYGWGTLRGVMAKGTGRGHYLAAKLTLMTFVVGGGLAVVAVVTFISSLVTGAWASDSLVGVIASAEWGSVAVAFARTWFSLLPYIALAGFVAVLTQSSAAGMAVSLGYLFAELITVAILINLFDSFQTVADYVLGRNITAWMLGAQKGGVSGSVVGDIGLGEFPGDLHAFLVLVVYTLALGGLAFWLFHWKDVPGASRG